MSRPALRGVLTLFAGVNKLDTPASSLCAWPHRPPRADDPGRVPALPPASAAGRGRHKARERLERDVERAQERLERRRAAVPKVSYPEELPVSARRDDLLAAIRDNQVVIVAGETGSGKTTQLPKMCLELGRGVRGAIAHTQPRRLAARTVAERIADELERVARRRGRVRGAVQRPVVEDTLLRLMTDGLLLAEIQHDRLLRRYDTIIVDEAHERSLNIDFLLGYLKRILPRRPDLKVIITSATIDPERFSRALRRRADRRGLRPHVPGRGPLPAAARGHRPDRRDRGRGRGAAPGAARRHPRVPVRRARDPRHRRRARGPAALRRRDPAALRRQSTAAQQRVWKPHQGRRVVLATNVAETSLTVPGIHYVVDPGTARISRYSARLKVQRLPIEPVSQASADQRKGRCGRVAEGIAIRLYSEEDFEERPRFTEPEILRTSLAAVILQMAAIDLGDVEDFPFLDPPDRRQVRDGISLLQELGALDESGRKLTQLGRRLAQLPDRPADGPDGARGRRPRLRRRGDRDRRRAVDPGRPRAARGPAATGRSGARPPRRRQQRLPRLSEPVALPARAARRALASTSSASRPRASSCTTCGSASGRTSSGRSVRRPRASASRSTTRRSSRSRSTRRSCPGCSRTSGSRTAAGASMSAPATRGSRCGRGPA